MIRHKVVIIGGGPAGAACAGRLVEAGLDPLVVDKHTFPRQKVCAGWLTPDVFESLGIRPVDYPGDMSIFPSLRISLNGLPVQKPGQQYAIRRMEFDQWLLQRSAATFFHHEVKEIQVTERGFCLDGKIEAETLIGAGGTQCPVYRQFYADLHPRSGAKIIALEDEFQEHWEDPVCRLWFFENNLPGYAWYVPKKGGYINIGVGGNGDLLRQRGSSIHLQWEYLVQKIRRMGLIQKENLKPRGHVYHLRGTDPELEEGKPIIIGDALGLATLDMGEGIGPAIQSGLLAAEAILNNTSPRFDSIKKYSLLPVWLRWVIRK